MASSDRSAKGLRVRFGAFELDPDSGELRKSGIAVHLPPQPTQLLILLTRRAGEVVTREEIREALWGSQTIVDFEPGLNHCINQIRTALCDDAATPRYVQTLPRRGYRFVAPVQALDRRLDVADAARPATAAKRRRVFLIWVAGSLAVLVVLIVLHFWGREPASGVRLAVLPFANLSGDPGQEYLSDGLTQEMISHLGSLKPEELSVIARTSVMRYKNLDGPVEKVGRELGVDYVLGGSARREGARVRITAELIRVSDQTQL